jgi:Glycosyl transferase family 90
MSSRNSHPNSKAVHTHYNNNNSSNNTESAISTSTQLDSSTVDCTSIRPSPFDVVAVVDEVEDVVDEFESTSLQQQHLIAISIGSGSDSSSESDTISSSSRIVKKKKPIVITGSNSIMNEVRQRRSYLMNTLSRWDSSGKNSASDNGKNKNNNQYSNTQAPLQQQQQQQQHANNATTGARTFSQTLVISIASMCLVSLCTTMVWMFQVPHFNNNHQNSNSYIQNLMPSYDTSRTSSRSLTSTTFRPPPLLSIGAGAKFYIDPDTSIRGQEKIGISEEELERNDEEEMEKQQYNTHPKKVITFWDIAQRGSTDHRMYTNRQPPQLPSSHNVNVAAVTSHGEAITGTNTEDGIAVKSTNHKATSVFDRKSIQQQFLPPPLSSFSSSDIDLDLETGRAARFPSVDERVRVYMSNWYLPPCPSTADTDSNNDAFVQYNYRTNEKDGIEYMIFREARTLREKKRGLLRTFMIDDTTDFDVLRHLNYNNMLSCSKKSSYCKDFVKYLYPAMERAENDTATSINADIIDVRHIDNNVLMYQFSDAEKTRAYNVATGKIAGYPNVPNLKKFRYALSKEQRERILTSNSNDDNNCMVSPRPIPITILQQQMIDEGETKTIPTSQPIIMKLKIQRHYGYVQKIPALDIDWNKKKNQAIFRGQFTGRFPVGMDADTIKSLPAVDQCNLLHRCRLVYNAALNMKLIDAKLALPVLDVRKDFPQEINDVALYGDRVSIEDMLTYKAIIMLEGNDVSSGLKWALYSNSVVMTQTPTKTSWAMEELLEPWVHYVPLNDDLSDVEEKMQWIIDHDDEAKLIAYRGKLWIHDLVFHSDATADEELIFDEILRRTKAHYMLNTNLEVPMVDIHVE